MASTSQTRLEDFLPKSQTAPRPSLPAVSTLVTMADSTTHPHSELSVRRQLHTQRVYVLCGVVGSGKSTLAQQWEAIYPDAYVRVNQDSLGNRLKCEALVRESLLDGKSAIIDRQNFDASQRYTWLELGYAYHVEVVALVFQTSEHNCAERLKRRINHETVKTPQQGLQILGQMLHSWVAPVAVEGFHRMLALPPDLPLRYSLDDVNALLTLVEQKATLNDNAALPPSPPRSAFNPHGRGTYRQPRGSSGRGSSRVLQSWLGRSATVQASPQGYTAAASRGPICGSSPERAQPYRVPNRRSPATATSGKLDGSEDIAAPDSIEYIVIQ